MINMYHYPGMTDLGAMRSSAMQHADKGERVLLHLHPYEEAEDGCWIDADTLLDLYQSRIVEDQEAAYGHELFEPREVMA